jgi:hypothetical protein
MNIYNKSITSNLFKACIVFSNFFSHVFCLEILLLIITGLVDMKPFYILVDFKLYKKLEKINLKSRKIPVPSPPLAKSV